MKGTIINIAQEQLLDEVKKMADDGQRFGTMTCTDLGDKLDLLYHFDKDLQLTHLRCEVAKGSTLPSISGIYFAALVIENEIQDFFPLKFEGLAIDYKGKFVVIGNEGSEYDSCTDRPDLSSPAAKIQVVDKKEMNQEKGAVCNG